MSNIKASIGVPLSDLQKMAQASYRSQPEQKIGSYTLVENTPTIKIYQGGNKVVIAVRGTEKTDTEDLEADAMAIAGQLASSRRYKKDLAIVKEFADENPDYQYVGTGHSLGGGIIDLFLKAGLIRWAVTYNPLVQPQDLTTRSQSNHRIYQQGDFLYNLFGKYVPGIEVRKSKDSFWNSMLRHAIPFYNAYDSLQKHKLKNFEGGMRPIICRVGSKTPFVKLLEYVMPEHEIYVEPFVGSGAFYWHKAASKRDVVNDLDESAINTMRLIKKVSSDFNDFPDVNNAEKAYQFWKRKPKNSEEELLRQIIKHCGGFQGTILKENAKKIAKYDIHPNNRLRDIAEYKQRMKNTTIYQKDYATVIKDWDTAKTFFYLDPPYEKSTKAFNYAQSNDFDFERFADVVSKIKGKFIVSLNDSPKVRQLFKDYHIYSVTLKGQPRKSGTGIGHKNRDEVLISNYPFPSDWKQHLNSTRLMTGGSIFTDIYSKAKSLIFDPAIPQKIRKEVDKQLSKDSFVRKDFIPIANDIATMAQPFIDAYAPGVGTAIKSVAKGIHCANSVASALGYGYAGGRNPVRDNRFDFDRVEAPNGDPVLPTLSGMLQMLMIPRAAWTDVDATATTALYHMMTPADRAILNTVAHDALYGITENFGTAIQHLGETQPDVGLPNYALVAVELGIYIVNHP